MIEVIPKEEATCQDDTISRQAVIDAMCELMHHWFGGDPKDEIREIKRELEKLPSAQPKTCTYWDRESNFCALHRPSVEPETHEERIWGVTVDKNVAKVWDQLIDLPSAEPENCGECKHLGKWENEVEYGYPSPCTRCKRRVSDNYER